MIWDQRILALLAFVMVATVLVFFGLHATILTVVATAAAAFATGLHVIHSDQKRTPPR